MGAAVRGSGHRAAAGAAARPIVGGGGRGNCGLTGFEIQLAWTTVGALRDLTPSVLRKGHL